MPAWLDMMLVVAAVSVACVHLGWRWLRVGRGDCAGCASGQCPGQGKAEVRPRRDP
jgi:hypothetical protein